MEATFRVYRWNPPGGKPRYDPFTVQLDKGMTILTALLQIKEEQDDSLAFRRSCRSGVCGSCAMTINGRAGLACKTRVVDRLTQDSEVVLEPLRHLPVIRDLVVDLGPFWQGLEALRPWLVNNGPFPDMPWVQPLSQEQLERLDHLIDCNLCAACHSECSPSGLNVNAPSPAAMAKLYRFILDPRDGLGTERVKEAVQAGLWRCPPCSDDVCPRGVRLQEALSQMRDIALERGYPEK
jgi:succinate dehydrogenase/fumarate reductase iron-sulfur protein